MNFFGIPLFPSRASKKAYVIKIADLTRLIESNLGAINRKVQNGVF